MNTNRIGLGSAAHNKVALNGRIIKVPRYAIVKKQTPSTVALSPPTNAANL